jgi:hypothetical protein
MQIADRRPYPSLKGLNLITILSYYSGLINIRQMPPRVTKTVGMAQPSRSIVSQHMTNAASPDIPVEILADTFISGFPIVLHTQRGSALKL